MNIRPYLTFASVILFCLQLIHPVILLGASNQGTAIVSGLHGQVSFYPEEAANSPTPVLFNQPISPQGHVRTSFDGDTQILFGTRCLASVGPASTVKFPEHSETQSVVQLDNGILELASSERELRDNERCKVLTPNGVALSKNGILHIVVSTIKNNISNMEQTIETFSVIEGEATITPTRQGTPVQLRSGEMAQVIDGKMGDIFTPSEPIDFLPICAVDPHCVISRPLPVALSQVVVPTPVVIEQVIIPTPTPPTSTPSTPTPPTPTPPTPLVPGTIP